MVSAAAWAAGDDADKSDQESKTGKESRRQHEAWSQLPAALVGGKGMVVERVANLEAVGAIRMDNGEVWTARAFDENRTYDVGERVEVLEIRGATALIHD